MTTQEIADRYLELYRQGNVQGIRDELYSADIVCREPEHAVAIGIPTLTTGIDAVNEKTRARSALIEQIHSAYCSEPVVGGTHFSVAMGRDVTFKSGDRRNFEQICVFGTKDDKIITETFFY